MKPFPFGRFLYGCLLILLANWPAAAAAMPKTDVITLVNGDVITCEIKEMVRGKMRVKTDNMGEVYIEWDKIARVVSDYWFLISRKDGSLVYGQIFDSGENGSMVVSFQEMSATLPMSSVVEIQPIRYDFWDRFDVSVALGINWTKASQVLQSNFDASAEYKGQLYSWGLDASSMITEQGEGDITRNNELNIYLGREISGDLNVKVNSGLYRNDELGVRLRLNGGASLGYYLLRSSHLELQALTGANLNREWSSADAPASNNAEARLGTSFTAFYYDTPKTDLTIEADLYPNLTDGDRTRFEGSISARQEIVKDLFIKVEYYESQDTKPPPGANAKEDRGIVFSIEWTK